jgi:hypothetical protein
MRAPILLLVLALGASAGCSLVLDRDRHRGAERDAGLLPDPDASPDDGGAGAPDASVMADAPALDALDATAAQPDAGDCDRDRDGHDAVACGGDDCDDTRADVHPGATPICGSGRVESCTSPVSPELLELLGAEELGMLPRVALAAGEEIAPDVAAAVIGGPGASAPGGTALVVYRVRAETGYLTRSRIVDLATGAERDLFGTIYDTAFARAVGSGDLGGASDRGLIAVAASSPDEPELRGLVFDIYGDGSTGARSVTFVPPAFRGVAIAGGETGDALVFASDDTLVRFDPIDGTTELAPLDAPLEGWASIRGEGAGPFVHFRGSRSVVWNVGRPSCSGAAECASGVCREEGWCAPGAPRPVATELESRGLSLAYRNGTLWSTRIDPVRRERIAVGPLDCSGPECIALGGGEVVLDASNVMHAAPAPLADDAVAVIAAAATSRSVVVRAAFHRPSDGRQMVPFDLDLFELAGMDVEGFDEARATTLDPRTGAMTQVIVAATQPRSAEGRIVLGGLRVCELR